MKNRSQKKSYHLLLGEIKKRIRVAQYQALRAVNRELVNLYWDIGRLIVKRQQGNTWGKAIVQQLANDLHMEFPGISGFSAQNLWRMRQLYEAYSENEKLSPLVREIGWSHNIIILMHCKEEPERAFYIRKTIELGWTKDVLTHQIELEAYRQTRANQTNFPKTLPRVSADRLKNAVKDEYTLDFLDMAERHTERQLEKAILVKMDAFLREMGGLFAFLGRQYRLQVADKEYFIDILLYHRRLKCLVAIELKVGEFLPEYIGKMQFYLAALDDMVRLKDESASIGIVLCKSKNKTIVEYALRDSRKPIGVASYRLMTKLPKELRKNLPAPHQMEKLISVGRG